MKLKADADTLQQLLRLQQETKFTEEEDGYYPGAPTEETRLVCEQRVNEFIGEIVALLQGGATKDALIGKAVALVEAFDGEDTEEREKVGDYVGDVMHIVGVDDWLDLLRQALPGLA